VPASLDFGRVRPGGARVLGFTIANAGNDEVIGDVVLENAFFSVVDGAGPFSLQPGQTLHARVRFAPQVPGDFDATVDLGTECPGVPCLGAGAEPWEDLVGVYFDENGATHALTTTQPFEAVAAYLVLTDATEPSGVSGWECCVALDGSYADPIWTVVGTALNVLDPPCFAVGLGVPNALPWQEAIVLARLDFLQVTPLEPTFIYVGPVPQPSLPGWPVYAAGDDPYRLLPLGIASGSADVPVAIVNGGPPPPAPPPPSPPPTFALHAPFPNPFNPYTVIRFDLPQPGHVRLEVFDLGGHRVRDLLDADLPAASYEREWNGLDDRGRQAPSGTYYCRLSAGVWRAMQRMTLLR
jgi:hypothetical protein